MSAYSTIVLVTDSFPFGGVTERSFVCPELKALSQVARVVIMPLVRRGAQPDDVVLPQGVEVDSLLCDHVSMVHKLCRLRFLWQPSVYSSAAGDGYFTGLKQTLAAHELAYRLERWMESKSMRWDDTLFYSFWFGIGAYAMSLLASRHGARYVSRAHRYDIYTRTAMGLRESAVRHSAGVFAVSEAGAEALRRDFPGCIEKIRVSMLGSEKTHPDSRSSRHEALSRRLTFLSVSRVAPEKRVHINFDMMRALAVARPNTAVRWIHVGDGSDMSSLKSLVGDKIPVNLEVNFIGELPNSAVQDIYLREPIDWFLLMSDSEGLPISICEAMSYGVPVAATDVGGVSEIVTDDCGMLLPDDVTPEEFVRGIVPYIDSDLRVCRICDEAYRKWHDHFRADMLREEFVNNIMKL